MTPTRTTPPVRQSDAVTGCDGPCDYDDRLNANIDHHRAQKKVRRERAAKLRELPMSEHLRRGLDSKQRYLIRAARCEESTALRANYLTDAKRIADQLAIDDQRRGRKPVKFCEQTAARIQVAKKTIERAVSLGSRLLPNLAEAVAGGPYDNPADLQRIAQFPLDAQHAFARSVADRRYELSLAGEILDDGRLRRLDHATLDALDSLGRNDKQTRRYLADMSQRDAIETVGTWQRGDDRKERRAKEIEKLRQLARVSLRTPALRTANAAWDAMTEADRKAFKEIHGLQRALVIAGECPSIAFDAVEGEDA